MSERALELLRAEVARTSVTAVAARLPRPDGDGTYSRSALSRVLSGSYGDTTAIYAVIEDVLGGVDCPHLAERIAISRCQAMHQRKTPPIQRSEDVAHWRACQHCPRNPATGRGEEVRHG